jgi:hypothetical protein
MPEFKLTDEYYNYLLKCIDEKEEKINIALFNCIDNLTPENLNTYFIELKELIELGEIIKKLIDE